MSHVVSICNTPFYAYHTYIHHSHILLGNNYNHNILLIFDFYQATTTQTCRCCCHKEPCNPRKEREDLAADAMLMYVCLCVCVMSLVAYFYVLSNIVMVDV